MSGFRTIVTVDDLFITDADHEFIYAQISEDGGIWAAVVEKAAAKLYGNYENLEGGDVAEGMM